jgi:DNA polymerase-3 subunit delta'
VTTDIAGTEDHPHARVTLAAALATGPSHAYLFHGPAGVGKRDVARAFAAELLAEGEAEPDAARLRALHGSHPDLTWVKPSGAAQMRVDDVDKAVVTAATRTPFESKRRVFVLERADEMNDTVANRLLKTLEEPASFVHIILITNSLGQVLPTVVSRCQAVRFDPLPPARIAERLQTDGVPADRAAACARLALGNGDRARFLASDDGDALRVEVDRMIDSALRGGSSGTDDPPWAGLLEQAKERKLRAEEAVAAVASARLESEPKGRDRGALEKQFEAAATRDGRRAQTEHLDLGLTLAALGFRDLVCVAEGAPDAAFDAERAHARADAARGRDPRRLRAAAEQCEDTRLSLEVNVTEDLALDALGFRLARLVGSAN